MSTLKYKSENSQCVDSTVTVQLDITQTSEPDYFLCAWNECMVHNLRMKAKEGRGSREACICCNPESSAFSLLILSCALYLSHVQIHGPLVLQHMHACNQPAL